MSIGTDEEEIRMIMDPRGAFRLLLSTVNFSLPHVALRHCQSPLSYLFKSEIQNGGGEPRISQRREGIEPSLLACTEGSTTELSSLLHFISQFHKHLRSANEERLRTQPAPRRTFQLLRSTSYS